MNGKKSDGSWQMTMNYWELDKAVLPHLWGCAQHCNYLRYLGHSPGSVSCCTGLSKCLFQYTPGHRYTRSFYLCMAGTAKSLWTFQVLFQSYLHGPTICHVKVAWDLSLFSFPAFVKWVHYTDYDIMLRREDLPLLQNLCRFCWNICKREDEWWTQRKFKGQTLL